MKRRSTRRQTTRPTGIPRGSPERLIVGYHGCERRTARRRGGGDADLEPSRNDYDWLGEGVYFWEHGLRRAQEFAEEKRERGELRDPVVIGAYLQLGRCLDLTDVWSTRLLARYFRQLKRDLASEGIPLPTNGPSAGTGREHILRRLDCAVINYCLESVDAEFRTKHAFDTVRGAFEEGAPAFPGAAIRKKSHVQISVRNAACILGIFRPAGYSL
jgi:hypothetical protein